MQLRFVRDRPAHGSGGGACILLMISAAVAAGHGIRHSRSAGIQQCLAVPRSGVHDDQMLGGKALELRHRIPRLDRVHAAKLTGGRQRPRPWVAHSVAPVPPVGVPGRHQRWVYRIHNASRALAQASRQEVAFRYWRQFKPQRTCPRRPRSLRGGRVPISSLPGSTDTVSARRRRPASARPTSSSWGMSQAPVRCCGSCDALGRGATRPA